MVAGCLRRCHAPAVTGLQQHIGTRCKRHCRHQLCQRPGALHCPTKPHRAWQALKSPEAKPFGECLTVNAQAGGASASAPDNSDTASGTGGQQSRLADRLRRWGVAGVAAYGVLNTLYYSAAMCSAWFFVAKVPPGIGLQEGLRKLAEVGVSAWALSQVTKVPRAFGCAPLLAKVMQMCARRVLGQCGSENC